MILLVSILVVIVGQSVGVPQSPYSVLPKYLPASLVTEPLFEELHSSLDNLESRESYTLGKLELAVKEANLNTDFVNRCEQILYPNYQFHQEQQDQRISDLETRITEIEAIKDRAQSLREDAGSINEQINTQVYPDRKQIMYDLDHLRNLDLELNSDLTETLQGAEDVEERVDALFEKAWGNSRCLLDIDASRKEGTQAVNAQTTSPTQSLELEPNSEDSNYVTVNLTRSLGVPQFSLNTIVGFDVEKQHCYATGYPSLYFGTYTDVHCSEATYQSVDMSSGCWTTDDVIVSTANIYFSKEKLVSRSQCH